MADSVFDLQITGLEGLKNRTTRMRAGFKQAPREVAKACGDVLLRALKEEAPKRTGEMADSLNYKIVGSAAVGYTASFYGNKVATFVIGGTRPHPIDAAPGHVLHFFLEGGEEIFTPHVDHPGTRANDFRKPAWSKAKPEVQAILRAAGSAVMRGEALRALGPGI